MIVVEGAPLTLPVQTVIQLNPVASLAAPQVPRVGSVDPAGRAGRLMSDQVAPPELACADTPASGNVSGMPQLPEGQSYQLWLYPSDGTAPASLGTFDANGFGEPVTFRGLDRFAAMGISVEPSSGSEVPTSEPIVGVDLDPTAQTGPRYGGRPSNN